VVGKAYKVATDAYAPSTNGLVNGAVISVTSAPIAGGANAQVSAEDVIQNITFTFVADATSVTLYLFVLNRNVAWGTSSDYAYFDNVTVKEYISTTGTGTVPKGLLIEEQRTNLTTQSNNLTSFLISPATGLTSILDSNVAPDGTVTARRLTNTTTTEQHRLIQFLFSIATSTAYTYTVYLKNESAGWVQLSFYTGIATTAFANFNLVTGVLGSVGNGTATITPVGNNWYRCSLTATTENTSGNLQLYVLEANSGSANPSTTGTGKSVFVWGAQLEAGAFPTSYIPTVASQVTRAADVATMVGNNFARWYNVNEGTMYSEAATVRTSGYGNIFQLLESTLYRTDMGLIGPSGYEEITINGSGVATWDNANAINVNKYANGTFAKASLAYALNNSNAAVNGVAGTTDTSCTLPVAVLARIGTDQSNRYLNGTIKRIAYYPRRLANTELQGITS
jgi:hypothetical protein